MLSIGESSMNIIKNQEKRDAIKNAIESLQECARLGLSFTLENSENGQSIGFNDQGETLATYTCKHERELVFVPYIEEPFWRVEDKAYYNYESFMGEAYEPRLHSSDTFLSHEIIKELSKKDTVYLIYTYKGNNHKKIWGAYANIEDAKKALPKYEKFLSFKIESPHTIDWLMAVRGEDLAYWLHDYK